MMQACRSSLECCTWNPPPHPAGAPADNVRCTFFNKCTNKTRQRAASTNGGHINAVRKVESDVSAAFVCTCFMEGIMTLSRRLVKPIALLYTKVLTGRKPCDKTSCMKQRRFGRPPARAVSRGAFSFFCRRSLWKISILYRKCTEVLFSMTRS